jgi:AcrR family transcriptional regulator
VSRWEPDARGRLERAALDLYAERGFEQTTVAEIAKRAGLTERTFFRHYADKREVLFDDSGALRDVLFNAVTDAPESATPFDATAAGLVAIAARLQDRRDYAGQRHAIINSNTELRARELTKQAALATGLADALRRRGVPDGTASLTAEACVAVFRVAFERWITEGGQQDLPRIVRESIAELRSVTGHQAT